MDSESINPGFRGARLPFGKLHYKQPALSWGTLCFSRLTWQDPHLTLPASLHQPPARNLKQRPPGHMMVHSCRQEEREREGFPASPLSILLLCSTKGHCLSSEGPWREAPQGAGQQGWVSSGWASKPSKHQGRNRSSKQAPESRQAQWHSYLGLPQEN